MPTPNYPEYPELWEQARRAARGFVDPARIAAIEAITHERGTDWCTAVLGRSFPGLRHVDLAEAELLRLAHEHDLDPPLPAELAAARRTAAEHRAMIAQQRQQQVEQDQREWTVARRRAGVPAAVLQVRANVRGGGRSAHLGGGRLHHVVPTVELWSGPDRRPRRHPVGRALCETEHRSTPLLLGEPSDQPATCVRCLTWTSRVRPTPATAAPPYQATGPGQQGQVMDGAPVPGPWWAPAVDAEGVVEAARVATAHAAGNLIRGHQVCDNVVRVDLCSRLRARESATFLAGLGYRVAGLAPASDGSGWSVTVAGWSAAGLGGRLVELERAVHDLELHHGDVASEAVDRFRTYLRQGMGEHAARRQVIAEAPPPPPAPARLGPAVAERDLTLGPPEHRGALVRIAATQAAWRILASSDAAEAAVGMFVEFRRMHGHHVDRAQAAAVAEVTDGARAAHEIALSQLHEKLEAGLERDPVAGGRRRSTPAAPGVRPHRQAFDTAVSAGRNLGGHRVEPPAPPPARRPHHRVR